VKAIADLLDGRATHAALEFLAGHPDTAAQLDTFRTEQEAGGPTVPDAVAAEAYEVFGRGVFPFSGVFLDDDGGARGPLADTLRSGTLPRELGDWLGAFKAALRDLHRPVASAVAEALPHIPALPVLPVSDPDLCAIPPALDDPKTDLRAMAEFLCQTNASGVFLSSPVIERIARAADVPRGFGDRRLILNELLRTSARYDRSAHVFEALAQVVQGHLETADRIWRPRLEATDAWLEAARSALS
jgi:hypothetical protein